LRVGVHDRERQRETEKQVEARLKEAIVSIQEKLVKLSQDLPEMLATHQKMKNTMEELTKLKGELEGQVKGIEGKVNTANTNLILVLQAEEKMLEDRLSEIRRTLKDLQK
jgi:chromosome segregation ATPase